MFFKKSTLFFISFSFLLSFTNSFAADMLKQKDNADLKLKLANKTYGEIIRQNFKPEIPIDYKFPVSIGQVKNGCFAYAMKNIVKYKYDEDIDVKFAVKEINKPLQEVWASEHIWNFLQLYNLEIDWFVDTETFFLKLIEGEPLLIQYRYYFDDTRFVGHFVAAYSFDSKGVYIAQSITGKLERLDYSHIFDETGQYTKKSFGVVIKK